ncbi:hypothetical protein FGU71_07890 [Erythrobacter insulae]|uniref:Uncharacterized protein n=1 Tax=Erythrobacter insulae TaxID=2584124 RepID=A0A547PCB2_9SPHN|nr:hypothetical protein [Erythrobacter insulae]TRD11787.1 hypothetical protein FGU71_07890 [Erythrobacter insulae]
MFETVLEYRVEFQRLASILLMLAALKWGSAPERAVTLVFAVLFTLPLSAFEFWAEGPLIFSGSGSIYIALDLVALALFLAIALNANRTYTLWIAGFQIVPLASHLVRGVVDAVSPLAYAVLAIGPSYFQLILMGGGLLFHIRRKKRYGEYRAWRVQSFAPFNSKTKPAGLRSQL